MNSQMLNPCSSIGQSKFQSTRNSSPGTERIDYPIFYGNSEVQNYQNITFFPSEKSNLKLPQIKDRTAKPQGTNQFITFLGIISDKKSGCSSVASLIDIWNPVGTRREELNTPCFNQSDQKSFGQVDSTFDTETVETEETSVGQSRQLCSLIQQSEKGIRSSTSGLGLRESYRGKPAKIRF